MNGNIGGGVSDLDAEEVLKPLYIFYSKFGLELCNHLLNENNRITHNNDVINID